MDQINGKTFQTRLGNVVCPQQSDDSIFPPGKKHYVLCYRIDDNVCHILHMLKNAYLPKLIQIKFLDLL